MALDVSDRDEDDIYYDVDAAHIGFVIDDLPVAGNRRYQYQVSNLWTMITEDDMNGIDEWLESTGIDAEFYIGYGDIRFSNEKDRTLFLLQYS